MQPIQHHHRPTLKQVNKPYKSKYASSRALKRKSSGRVNPKVGAQITNASINSRKDRANQARAQRRAETVAQLRILKQQAKSAPPVVIVLLPITKSADPIQARNLFVSALRDENGQHSETSNSQSPSAISCTVPLPPNFNCSNPIPSNITFLVVSRNSLASDNSQNHPVPLSSKQFLLAALDALKVADIMLPIFADDEKIDDQGYSALAAVRSQGVPHCAALSILTPSFFSLNDDMNLDSATAAVAAAEKKKMAKKAAKARDLRKQRARTLFAESMGNESDLKPWPIDSSSDAVNALRMILGKSSKPITWREKYGYMIVENVTEKDPSTLVVAGYIRGRPFSANRLIHISGVGSFAVAKIVRAQPPQHHHLSSKRDTHNHHSMDDMEILLSLRNEQVAEPVDHDAVPDPMAGEQTWPSDHEGDGTYDPRSTLQDMAIKRKNIKVPKGCSEYQAAWISDNEDQSENDCAASDASYESMMEDEHPVSKNDMDDNHNQGNQNSEKDSHNDTDDNDDNDEPMDFNEASPDQDTQPPEAHLIEALRQAARDDIQFPDEMDTPMDQDARIRFARYRGLKSFRTSPWDPKENLPMDYAKLFQFADFSATRKRVLKEASRSEHDPNNLAPVGAYVCLYLTNVDSIRYDKIRALAADSTSSPLILFSMHKFENLKTVIHMGLQRITDAVHQGQDPMEPIPIKSKDLVEFHIGFFRLWAKPIYSEANANCDKNKLERYFQVGRYTVATAYGPALFPSAPVLAFSSDGQLFASGALLPPNPDRIVLKRIVLSGFPFKAHKKKAVVRFMFFNPADVRWFKPVELWTKHGRIGNINEPLGTHGYMKCTFDANLSQQDTICMSLYKRIYPKLPDEKLQTW